MAIVGVKNLPVVQSEKKLVDVQKREEGGLKMVVPDSSLKMGVYH